MYTCSNYYHHGNSLRRGKACCSTTRQQQHYSCPNADQYKIIQYKSLIVINTVWL